MKVLVTGAAGFIGRAVTHELLSHGHTVLGLCRSDSTAETIKSLGAEPVRGDIEDLSSLAQAAKQADGVIHLAFKMDFSDFPGCCAVDRAAIQTFAEAMKGTRNPLVITTGTLLLPSGELSTESTEVDREGFLAVRAQSEDLLKKLSRELDVRGSVARLAPTVHGGEDKGFIKMLGDIAKKNEFVAYVEGGEYHWPAVHRLDAAVLYRLALEKGTAGSVYHGVAEEGVSLNQIMEAIGRKLGLPVKSISKEDAPGLLGFFAGIVTLDNRASSKKTKTELGWTPTRETLLDDIKKTYFETE